jgi:hypothetical protein
VTGVLVAGGGVELLLVVMVVVVVVVVVVAGLPTRVGGAQAVAVSVTTATMR